MRLKLMASVLALSAFLAVPASASDRCGICLLGARAGCATYPTEYERDICEGAALREWQRCVDGLSHNFVGCKATTLEEAGDQ